MITKEKLKIYLSYKGDIDQWARSGSRKEKELMDDDSWYIIDGLIQDLCLVFKGKASEVFKSNVEKRLREDCDSDETIHKLKEIAVEQ